MGCLDLCFGFFFVDLTALLLGLVSSYASSLALGCLGFEFSGSVTYITLGYMVNIIVSSVSQSVYFFFYFFFFVYQQSCFFVSGFCKDICEL